MWSFAVLLWELVTREVPFADLSHMEIGMKVSECGVHAPTGFCSVYKKNTAYEEDLKAIRILSVSSCLFLFPRWLLRVCGPPSLQGFHLTSVN